MQVDQLIAQLDALHASGAEFEAVLEAVVKGVHQLDRRFHWTGIYELFPDNILRLGPFIGAPTEHVFIGVGQGVCGTAVAEKRNMNIPDVSRTPNYLACSSDTRSELVVLIRRGDTIYAQIRLHAAAAPGMSAKRPSPADAQNILAGLEPLFAADTVETVLEQAAALLGGLTEAHATALLLTDGSSVVHEAWHPADEGRRARLRPHLLGLTLQSVKTDEAVTLPFPAGAAAGLSPHMFLLKARGRALGAVCCACKRGDKRQHARRQAQMEPIVRLVAQRIVDVQEAVSSRATRAQYERWFRQLDSHIRTLDRERQKFAAVVNQSDVYIYVADATRTIKATCAPISATPSATAAARSPGRWSRTRRRTRSTSRRARTASAASTRPRCRSRAPRAARRRSSSCSRTSPRSRPCAAPRRATAPCSRSASGWSCG